MAEAKAPGDLKLSCRNVWKVYGADPGGFFPNRNGKTDDARAHIAKIREGKHIVACADDTRRLVVRPGSPPEALREVSFGAQN